MDPGNLPPISMAQSGLPVLVLGTNCIAAAADNLVARNGDRIRVTYADFTYVALDEAGRPRPVPSKPAA